MKTRQPLALALATALVATNSLAGSLTLIPTLSGDTVNSGRAITPDGRYVVGSSGSRGFLYPVGNASAINVISSDNAQSSIATGVGYRVYNGQQQLIVRGLTSSGNTDWMTPDGGTTWGIKRRDTNLGSAPWTVPAFNAMSSSSSDVYYSAFRDNANMLRVGKAWGAWAPASNTMTLAINYKSVPSGEEAVINGVSANGRAVGRRGGRTYVFDWSASSASGTQWFATGLQNNATGEVFSVSYDGSVLFGRSPVSDGRSGLWGFRSVYSGTSLLDIKELPRFGNEAGSTSLQTPYGTTPDGSAAVGMSYRGSERAVLWVTVGDSADWYARDLTQVAQAEGILGDFTRLSRAYSVALTAEGFVITGEGALADGTRRAFVMTVIPEPTALALLTIGGLLAVVFRRRL